MRTSGVRIATAADARAIADVHVRSWQHAYRGLVPDEYLEALTVDRRAEMWTGVFARNEAIPANRAWVFVDDDDDVVGFSCAGRSRDEGAPPTCGELFAIYILADAYGRGVGQALHDAALDWCSSLGCDAATAWVVEGNEHALRFYARQGWMPDGERKLETWDGVTMRELRIARAL